MAKGRVINKSISTSEKINLRLRNPLDCLLYTWGLTHADDDGRIDGHATIYRSKVAPALPGLTDHRVDLSLTAMEKAHLITRYTIGEVMVVQFLDWNIHQSFKGFQRKPSHLPPEPKNKEITQKGDNHPILPVKETKVKESNINKDRYLDFVHLSQIEYSNLLKDYGKIQTEDLIKRLNDYIGSKGDKYKSHYFTLLNFARRDNMKKIVPVKKNNPTLTPPLSHPTEEQMQNNEQRAKALVGNIGRVKLEAEKKTEGK